MKDSEGEVMAREDQYGNFLSNQNREKLSTAEAKLQWVLKCEEDFWQQK